MRDLNSDHALILIGVLCVASLVVTAWLGGWAVRLLREQFGEGDDHA